MGKITIYLLVSLFCINAFSCSKISGQKESGDRTITDSSSKKQGEQPSKSGGFDRQVSDTVFFGRWDGKRLILEDYYKYEENEKKMEQNPESYDLYGDKLKELVKKYSSYDEKNPEYSFKEFKPEFAAYTTLKIGDKVYVSCKSGVYAAEVSGYYLNFDDLIGAGSVFYAELRLPQEAQLEQDEIVVCSFNNNMKAVTAGGVTSQDVLDKFKSYLLPKLKGVKVSTYDDKGNESIKPLSKLANEEIKVFKGNFTASGSDQYLVSILLRNDFTNFTSAVFVMNEEGKILAELSPLTANNFTFSQPEMTVDFNGDGILEIITNDGYYEGGGYNFHKFENRKFKTLTTGFLFGV
ncbi:MAG: hypothetical protein IAE90_06000 [Ignavibacteria bacterium]|nr:hypothetical protein [Ignavibacteria bacterium]